MSQIKQRQKFTKQFSSALFLRQEIETYKDLSESDKLTGLLNYRGYQRALDEQIAKYRRSNYGQLEDDWNGLGLIYLDSIEFKKINDTLGDPVGDNALQIIASVLKKQTRAGNDTVARKGGDEFIILMAAKDSVFMQTMVEEKNADSILFKINADLLAEFRGKLKGDYIKKCDKVGLLRAAYMFISPADLEKPVDVLREVITEKLTELTAGMKQTKRKS